MLLSHSEQMIMSVDQIEFEKSNLCGYISKYQNSDTKWEWKVKDPLNAKLSKIVLETYTVSISVLNEIELTFSNGEYGNI